MDALNLIKELFSIKEIPRCPFEIKGLDRNGLYHIFDELGFSRGVEVGVYRGENAFEICNRMKNIKLFGVDFYKGYSAKRTDRTQRHFFRQARRALAEHIESGKFEFVKKESMEAAAVFDNCSLDFVYIDANHNFDYVMRDIIEWAKKVRVGGIVSGHDYYRDDKRKGVVVAVDAYVRAHRIRPWFVTNEKRKRSFFWVKE